MKHYEVQHNICRLSYTKFYLSDLEMAFGMNPYLSSFRTGLVSQKRSCMMKINVGSTSLLQNNIDNYGKMGQT